MTRHDHDRIEYDTLPTARVSPIVEVVARTVALAAAFVDLGRVLLGAILRPSPDPSRWRSPS
jgi:hypothetical protein